MSIHCADGTTTSSILMRRMAKVLCTCVDAVERIECLIAPLSRAGSNRDHRLSMQEIDLLRQTLADIATALNRLSDYQDDDRPVDPENVLFSLHLNDLKSHLMGNDSKVRNPQPDCTLF
jgi:hypothetical protein